MKTIFCLLCGVQMDEHSELNNVYVCPDCGVSVFILEDK